MCLLQCRYAVNTNFNVHSTEILQSSRLVQLGCSTAASRDVYLQEITLLAVPISSFSCDVLAVCVMSIPVDDIDVPEEAVHE